ncbi:MAG TPA: methionine--tRNA ligase [Thermomicrobiales bacterium]|jgi:methionyl-tRNA synthetase|nr:methionine--tRNA ligase [Thermomicrobiales bacterium]
MSTKPSCYSVTTAIDYPNGAPHIGHALEKVAADASARYHVLRGDEVAFVMGNDENSQHVVVAAQNNGMLPGPWTDAMDVAFRRAWDALDVRPTDWVRTTEERHKVASRQLYERVMASGNIYKASYAGFYCPNCNNFYAEEDLVDGRCPNHPSLTPEYLEEENWFFRLSAFSDQLRELITGQEDFIVPAHRKAEVLGWIDQGLRDFSVSRAARKDGIPWGIPIPGDESQVMYVWFDALTTYLTGMGYGTDEARFERFWPADTHVIGKDITRHHCLYWPAMLMAAGLPVPRQVAVHGWLTLDGKRISKTTGNTIDPAEVVAEFGSDAVRYMLLRDVSFSSDGDFSRQSLIRRYRDDLANDLGNLLNRVVAMVGRYRGGVVPAAGEPGPLEDDLIRVATVARDQAEAHLAAWSPDRALEAIWTLVRRSNQYLEERQPWKLAKREDAQSELDSTLAHVAEAARVIAILVAPFIPRAAAGIMAQLGLPAPAAGDWERASFWAGPTVTELAPAGPLFPKLDDAVIAELG